MKYHLDEFTQNLNLLNMELHLYNSIFSIVFNNFIFCSLELSQSCLEKSKPSKRLVISAAEKIQRYFETRNFAVLIRLSLLGSFLNNGGCD